MIMIIIIILVNVYLTLDFKALSSYIPCDTVV